MEEDKRQSIDDENDPIGNPYFNEYLDSIIAEQKLKQENEILIDYIAQQTVELRGVRVELSEIRRQYTALAERMDYLEDVCLTDVPDELMKKHQIEMSEPPGHDPPSAAKETTPKTKMPRIVSGALRFLCTALLLIGVAAVTPAGMESNLFGFQHYIINTPSMLPEMPIGSLVLTKAVPPESIKAGDDITVCIGDAAYLTHRVVDITYDASGEPQFRTKGINNQAADPEPHSAALVAGKVVLCIPLLGKFMTFVQTHLSFVVVLFVMMLLTSVMLRPPRVKKKSAKTAANAAPI